MLPLAGPSCREILGQCAPGVCGNGSCVAVSQIAFRCNCRQGFTGTFCDKFTDMCTPNPCQNGATCVSRFMTYACLCQLGYTGELVILPSFHCTVKAMYIPLGIFLSLRRQLNTTQVKCASNANDSTYIPYGRLIK